MSPVLLQLLLNFLQIGLFSIGGGYATIPLIAEQVVQKNNWLSMQEFTDIITISQMTPGPLAINTSTFVGIRISGLMGAVVTTFGCVISGFLISILLYRFFTKYQNLSSISAVLKGLRSASTGLIAAATITILVSALSGSSKLSGFILPLNSTAVIIFAVSILLLRKLHWNPMVIMGLSGIAGIFAYGIW